MSEYAAQYDVENLRRIQEPYSQMIKIPKNMMIDGGNTSRFDGDLSPVYDLAEIFIEEQDAATEERLAMKEKEEKLQADLQNNEKQCLEGPENKKRKSADGNVSYCCFYSILFRYLYYYIISIVAKFD